ncbi:hypothetical protein J3R83DRAFT_6456 [Lanmaoa asiatica]|nr:hypothetical protein J3R83DRAFT_6456 [Lanmaoa asiatica]
MAASLRSPLDAHEDTLKPVPDRRHYMPGYPHPHHRARFPSLTEFPDSPSVYSHTYHSPNADVHSDTASFSRLSGPPGSLESDGETASTICSLSTEDVQDDSDVDDCTDDDASHRISLQGPKIRFHSRAPWETDDVIPHGEESDNSSRSATIGSKLRRKASRADNLIRTFTRGSSSRPSVDSARSQVSETSSFEITAGNYSSSRGALYDLARQSMSTSSLSSTASASVRHQGFARVNNYPKPSHYFTQTRTVSLDGTAPLSTTLENAPVLPSPSTTSRISNERSAKASRVSLHQERQPHDGFVHPYANPDLVAAYAPSPETIPSHHPILGDMSRSDSNSTITDSTSTRSAALSVISTETSTSLISRDLQHGNPRVNGKEISSPISVLCQSDISYVDRDTRFLSLHPPPTSFDDPRRSNPRSPTVTLISLQEAQARERYRSNTVHTTFARTKLPFSNSDDIPEAMEDQTEEVDTAGILDRTRARSTSIGTRHKTVPLLPAQSQITEMRESAVSTSASAVPGRALKHKKSGFMRLFSGRNSEGEKERCPPPPIPPLADVYAEQSSEIHRTGKTSKTTLTRTPKSSLSPTLRSGASNATLASTNSASSGGDGPDGRGPSSRRRQPPSLSIVTKSSDHSISTSVAGQGSPMSLNFTPPPSLSFTVPQSAPPGSTDFPGLKLRPVSTSFSSHFADIVAGAVEELQHDAHTPSSAASSSTALSPFTPVSTRRSDDASTTAVETSGEEYLTIKGLQDQLVFTKKAWQQEIWELHGQIRDLTSELEDLRAADHQVYCEVCGRGEPQRRHASPLDEQQPKKVGIVNRPRARTGDTARFASGN